MDRIFKQIFPVSLICLLPFLAMGQMPQQKTIDSLQALLLDAKNDTAKINLLGELSDNYYTIDTKKGIGFGNKALELSKKNGYTRGMQKACYALGTNYWAKYDYITAQNYYGSALKIAEELGDKINTSVYLFCVGLCYQDEGNFAAAITYYKKKLKIDTELHQKDEIQQDLSYLGLADINQHKYDEALQFYNEALKLATVNGNQEHVAFYNTRLGVIFTSMNRFAEALQCEKVSIQLYEKMAMFDALAKTLGTMANTYLRSQNYPAAISTYENALRALDDGRNNTARGRAVTGARADFFLGTGRAYLYLSGFSDDTAAKKDGVIKPALLRQALKNFNESLALAKSIGYIENIAATLKNKVLIEEKLGSYKEAFATYKQYVIYRDSFSNSEKDKKYKQHEMAFEFSKKRDSLDYAGKLQKKEIAQVKYAAANKLKQQALYAIVAIVALLFIVSYFVFRNRIQKISFKNQFANEKAEVELKQALFETKLNDLTLASLKAQMNPHFIFNCLNSIKFYIENNNTDAASLYITKFSKLIRSILDSARSEKIMLSEELELIKLYLEMEGMRLKSRLSYELIIDDKIDPDFMEVPPLLIQPYVENAIWHGIMNKAEGGFVKLEISASANQKYLLIAITDNGVGRKRSAEIKSNSFLQHSSHGTKLTHERIEIFNAKYKTNIEVVITDLYDTDSQPNGTLVTIKLPTP